MHSLATPPIEFERAVVFGNPEATRSKTVQTEVAALQATFGTHRVLFMSTLPDGPQANRELIAQTVRPGDIAGAGGGDGTATLFDQAGVPVIPMCAGRACDLHHMLYGRRRRMVDILQHRHARLIDVLPLEATLTAPDEPTPSTTLSALAYISAGLTGKVAREHLGSEAARARHEDGLSGDIATIWFTIQHAQDYPVVIDGDKRRILDVIATRGHRIAKRGRTPNSLVMPRSKVAVYEGGTPHLKARVIKGLGLLALGLLPHQALSEDGLAFTALEDMVGQVDGEPFDIPAGWRLRIGNSLSAPPESRKPVRFLATARRL